MTTAVAEPAIAEPTPVAPRPRSAHAPKTPPADTADIASGMPDVRRIPLADLHESPLNARQRYDEHKLKELAESLRATGQLAPLLVRPSTLAGKPGYEIAAGHRRRRAAELAKLDGLLAIVRDLSDQEFLEILTIENLQREDLHPLDEALGYQQLLEKANYDVKRLADRVGKSETYVRQRLRLATLIPEARELFLADKITPAHAILIARLAPSSQSVLLKASDALWDWKRQLLPAAHLQRWIERQIYLDLHSAPWKKDDATLEPKAGACVSCEKRSGFAPALFPELAKKDVCLDGACFNRKLGAHIDRTAAALKTEHGEVVQISHGWSHQKPAPGKPLPAGQYAIVKPGTRGSKPAVIVDGPEAGHVAWITTEPPKTRDRVAGVPDYAASQRRAEKRAKAAAELRRAQFKVIADWLPTTFDAKWWHFVVRFLVEEMHHDALAAICRILGLETTKAKAGSFRDYNKRLIEHAEKLDAPACARLVLQLLLAPALTTSLYGTGDAQRLTAAAKLLRIDLRRVKVAAPAKTKAKAKRGRKRA